MPQSSEILRDKIHHYIDTIEDKKLEAMYVLFENEIEEEDIYSDELKATLDARYTEYKLEGNVVNESDADYKINNLLQNLKNK